MKRIKNYSSFNESTDNQFKWMEKEHENYLINDVSILLNETLVKIDVEKSMMSITFFTKSGRVFKMYHEHDCSEHVSIDDIEGDLDDLIGYPLTISEESTNREDSFGRTVDDSFTWTFYRFATIKGWCIIKWLGESNGYYSEAVDFYEILPINIIRLKEFIRRDLKISPSELEERITEFSILTGNKIDIISVEQLYHFYDKQFVASKFTSLI